MIEQKLSPRKWPPFYAWLCAATHIMKYGTQKIKMIMQ